MQQTLTTASASPRKPSHPTRTWLSSDSTFGAEGLRAFIDDLIDARVLDGLSECEADSVAMLVVLDFLKGPHQLAWRIHEWLNGRTPTRDDEDNPWDVCAALGSALKIMLDGLKPLGDPEVDAITADQGEVGLNLVPLLGPPHNPKAISRGRCNTACCLGGE